MFFLNENIKFAWLSIAKNKIDNVQHHSFLSEK